MATKIMQENDIKDIFNISDIDGIDTLAHLMEKNKVSVEYLCDILGRNEVECMGILNRNIILTKYDKLELGKRFCLDPSIFD